MSSDYCLFIPDVTQIILNQTKPSQTKPNQTKQNKAKPSHNKSN